jgi:hypothetical protein
VRAARKIVSKFFIIILTINNTHYVTLSVALGGTLKADGTRYMTNTQKGEKTASLAGTQKPDGTYYMTQADKGKLASGRPNVRRSETATNISKTLVIRVGNEMWYSLTYKPMIAKLIELRMFQSTIAHATAKKKMKTLKEKAAKGEFRLVASKDLWISAPDVIPKGAKLLD